jgi:hypothetical protein
MAGQGSIAPILQRDKTSGLIESDMYARSLCPTARPQREHPWPRLSLCPRRDSVDSTGEHGHGSCPAGGLAM